MKGVRSMVLDIGVRGSELMGREYGGDRLLHPWGIASSAPEGRGDKLEYFELFNLQAKTRIWP